MSTYFARKSEETSGHFEGGPGLSGFVVPGVLLGPVGALLIAWDYHIDGDPKDVGLHFLGLAIGYVAATVTWQRLSRRASLRFIALLGCGLGCVSLLTLSFLAPPAPLLWRIVCLALTGYAGGSLATALLHALEPYYIQSPVRSLNRSGMFFGAGCLFATITTGVVYLNPWGRIETAMLAVVPFFYFFRYAGKRFSMGDSRTISFEEEQAAGHSLREVHRIAASLFTLLLFFQFGSEWAIAGWLPLFLIHRLGSNPGWAIFSLTLYFLVLTLGRVVGQGLTKRVGHKKLLGGSTFVAMLGYLSLSLSPSLAIAHVSIVLVAAGFGPVYPLVAESLDERFRYRPGFYNGVFSIAITGAICEPWLLGYVDAYLGMRYVMLIPALGSLAVVLLIVLLMFESRLMGERTPVAHDLVGR